LQNDSTNDADIRALLLRKALREAFECLLDRYQNRVYGLIYGMVRNESTAQDLLQEVFLKIWKALPHFQGNGSFSSWVYTIGRNTALTEIRKSRPSISLDDPDWGDAIGAVTDLQIQPESGGEGMDTAALLNELPEKYRLVVTLFYLQQKSYEEVAAMLAIPMGTVKTLLHRAKKELLRIGARSRLCAPNP
jgi:RNA polymerase sigma-70 factor (ECF subfamily)